MTRQSSKHRWSECIPLRLASSKCNDPQMIAAGQINPVRAGSREDEMHLRFKAPPSSPQVISCHNAPREREQIVPGSYVRPAQLTDVARPDVLHPGAAGVTEAHVQASRLLCLSHPQFTAAKHEGARADFCQPTAVQRCHQQCFTTAQRQQLACTPVEARLTVPVLANAQCFTGESISKEIAVHELLALLPVTAAAPGRAAGGRGGRATHRHGRAPGWGSRRRSAARATPAPRGSATPRPPPSPLPATPGPAASPRAVGGAAAPRPLLPGGARRWVRTLPNFGVFSLCPHPHLPSLPPCRRRARERSGAGPATGSGAAAGVSPCRPGGSGSGSAERSHPPRASLPPALPGRHGRVNRRGGCPRHGSVPPRPPRPRGETPKERDRLTHGSAAGEAGDTSGFRGAGEVNCTEVQVVFSPIRSGRLKEGERGGGGGGGRVSLARSLSHTHTHTHTHRHTHARTHTHTHAHAPARSAPLPSCLSKEEPGRKTPGQQGFGSGVPGE
ncbi:uncharacterized protein LOC143693356 [Agelaius phoeniceus]|uniref:uncharacterized protein LOC143693356 n=1 Tax=Agelaius phoeniceus TaxID=39638 RepID=UPI004054EBC0